MQLQNPELFRQHCLVNGQWISAKNGKTIDVRNPATSELIGTVAALGRDQTRMAIDAAALAYPLWREMTAKERSLILRRWFDLILTHQEDLAVIMTTVGYAIWYHVLKKYDVNQVMPFMLLLPVSSTIGAVLFLGERPNLNTMIGGSIIIIGVAIVVIAGQWMASIEKSSQSDKNRGGYE